MSAHAGFPHSETSGSKPTYGSPKTFAVSRVLHRLPVPRHSPCALLHLTLQVCSFELSRSLCNVFIDLNDSRFFLGIKIFSFQRTNLAFPANGGKRDRTDDLLLAKQVLSQLSYAPRISLMQPDKKPLAYPGMPRLLVPCLSQISFNRTSVERVGGSGRT